MLNVNNILIFNFNFYNRHDEQLMRKLNKEKVLPQQMELETEVKPEPLPTQQFGVSLQFIKANNNDEVIPPIVRQCVEYLSLPDGKFK